MSRLWLFKLFWARFCKRSEEHYEVLSASGPLQRLIVYSRVWRQKPTALLWAQDRLSLKVDPSPSRAVSASKMSLRPKGKANTFQILKRGTLKRGTTITASRSTATACTLCTDLTMGIATVEPTPCACFCQNDKCKWSKQWPPCNLIKRQQKKMGAVSEPCLSMALLFCPRPTFNF